MKINFEKEIQTIEGGPIIWREKDKTFLKQVAVDVLQLTFQDETSLSGEEKAKRWLLATRIYANSDVDLTIDEVSLIKKLIGKAFGPIIVGPAFEILEGR